MDNHKWYECGKTIEMNEKGVIIVKDLPETQPRQVSKKQTRRRKQIKKFQRRPPLPPNDIFNITKETLILFLVIVCIHNITYQNLNSSLFRVSPYFQMQPSYNSTQYRLQRLR
jgi:hypothetical protein